MAEYPRSNRKRYQIQRSNGRGYWDRNGAYRPCYDVWGFWLTGDTLRWTIVYQGFSRKDCRRWVEERERAVRERSW